jgi:hypothetical protein
VRAKEDLPVVDKPLLMVDIDGVISLFGVHRSEAGQHERPDGSFHSIEGIPHFLSSTATAHLLALSVVFEPIWCSGWEEKANEHLPHLLGLPATLPFLRFSRMTRSPPARSHAHWKLEAIDDYAGPRPLAWIDDALNPACYAWAEERSAPTLLVETDPAVGLTEREMRLLMDWAGTLEAK